MYGQMLELRIVSDQALPSQLSLYMNRSEGGSLSYGRSANMARGQMAGVLSLLQGAVETLSLHVCVSPSVGTGVMIFYSASLTRPGGSQVGDCHNNHRAWDARL